MTKQRIYETRVQIVKRPKRAEGHLRRREIRRRPFLPRTGPARKRDREGNHKSKADAPPRLRRHLLRRRGKQRLLEADEEHARRVQSDRALPLTGNRPMYSRKSILLLGLATVVAAGAFAAWDRERRRCAK